MITAKRIRDTQRRAPIPVLDLLPFQQVTRDETEARALKDEPSLESWPRPIENLPELIAYHRQRAQRWRARMMRRAFRSALRWIAGAVAPAKAGAHTRRSPDDPMIMGPRLRGDDGG